MSFSAFTTTISELLPIQIVGTEDSLANRTVWMGRQAIEMASNAKEVTCKANPWMQDTCNVVSDVASSTFETVTGAPDWFNKKIWNSYFMLMIIEPWFPGGRKVFLPVSVYLIYLMFRRAVTVHVTPATYGPTVVNNNPIITAASQSGTLQLSLEQLIDFYPQLQKAIIEAGTKNWNDPNKDNCSQFIYFNKLKSYVSVEDFQEIYARFGLDVFRRFNFIQLSAYEQLALTSSLGSSDKTA